MQASQQFELIYTANIPDIPSSATTLNLWTPFPSSTPHQEIHSICVETDFNYRVHYDPQYGNAVLHCKIATEKGTPIKLKISTQATRYEWSMKEKISTPTNTNTTEKASHFYLQLSENKHIRFEPELRSIAKQFTAERRDPISLAHAVYSYVLSSMEYDKTVDGWGKGDTGFACAIGKGNCTDFHSLFLALARVCGLPAQFEIGVAFPKDMQAGDITMFKCGYHCWATFFVQGIGWIPVDCSEASLHTDLTTYYFGNLDANRFLLSRGRDIDLVPRQQGEPLNFFTEPYVETDTGIPVYCEKQIHFRYL